MPHPRLLLLSHRSPHVNMSIFKGAYYVDDICATVHFAGLEATPFFLPGGSNSSALTGFTELIAFNSCVLLLQYFCFHTFFFLLCNNGTEKTHKMKPRWWVDDEQALVSCEQPSLLIFVLHHYFLLYFNIWLTLVGVFLIRLHLGRSLILRAFFSQGIFWKCALLLRYQMSILTNQVILIV
jgi:hypothetical protein